MTNTDEPTVAAAPASQQTPSSPSRMRDLFPGYYPPSEDDVKAFLTDGLIVLDTNALLSIYRFTDQARTEYLDTLRLLKDRLWVPHHVASEFFDNRVGVIRDCGTANKVLIAALEDPLSIARDTISDFAKYRGLLPAETEMLTQILDDAETQILVKLNEIYDFDLDPDADPRTDPLLDEIEALLDGKIGPAFGEKEAGRAVAEGKRRINNRIPPGYEDKKSKGDDKAIGDYLLWVQTIEEAKRRELPVLLITNDEKEDWVHLDKGRAIGPRTELVLEMRTKASQKFHIATVQTFLIHAKKYLSAPVSGTTVTRAAPVRHADSQESSGGAADGDSLGADLDEDFSPRAPGVDNVIRLLDRLAARQGSAFRLAVLTGTNSAALEAAQERTAARLAQIVANSSAVQLADREGAKTRIARAAQESAKARPAAISNPGGTAADDGDLEASADD